MDPIPDREKFDAMHDCVGYLYNELISWLRSDVDGNGGVFEQTTTELMFVLGVNPNTCLIYDNGDVYVNPRDDFEIEELTPERLRLICDYTVRSRAKNLATGLFFTGLGDNIFDSELDVYGQIHEMASMPELDGEGLVKLITDNIVSLTDFSPYDLLAFSQLRKAVFALSA